MDTKVKQKEVHNETTIVVGLCDYSSTVSAVGPGTQRGERQDKGPPKEIAVDLGGGVKFKMVLIPPGEFMMGSSDMGPAGSHAETLRWLNQVRVL